MTVNGFDVGDVTELASDLPNHDQLGVTKQPSDGSRALYLGRQTDFVYLVASASRQPLSHVIVSDPSCAPLRLISGDDGNDGVLGPKERWTFRCSAVADRSQLADVLVSAVTPTRRVVQALGHLSTPVLDPAIELRDPPTTGDGPALEIVNAGDSPLGDVVLDGRQCARRPSPGMRRTTRCSTRASGGRRRARPRPDRHASTPPMARKARSRPSWAAERSGAVDVDGHRPPVQQGEEGQTDQQDRPEQFQSEMLGEDPEQRGQRGGTDGGRGDLVADHRGGPVGPEALRCERDEAREHRGETEAEHDQTGAAERVGGRPPQQRRGRRSRGRG